MKKITILVVEDDEDIRNMLVFNLNREGYVTEEAENGLRCLEIARKKKPDLILLDLMMPEMDGLTACKELHKFCDSPIVFLTAKGEELDRVVGLELGAEDYVVKPFSIRELLLRIKKILKRTTNAPKAQESVEHLERNGIRIDVTAHKVFVKDEAVHATLTEFRLLEDLMRHAQLVRTREQLLDAVWGYHFEGYSRTVDTHIRRLRQKLGDEGALIETVRGLGYRIK